MGTAGYLKKPKIDDGVEEFKKTEGAVLLDVRRPWEFAKGRIPGSQNVPVREIENIKERGLDYDTPIYVYCLSGARSHQAVIMLKRMGYTHVIDLGGINNYSGETER